MATFEPRPTVLVADDEDAVRRLFTRILEGAGFAVCHARDGEEVLALIAERHPAVVLLDSRMPGLDGVATLRRLREDPSTRTLPVLMVTGHGDVDERVRGLEAGASDFIAKPVHPDELLARVRAQLRGLDAWREAIEESWAQRSKIVEAIGRIAADPMVADPAGAVCQALIGMPDTDGAAVLGFVDRKVVVLAQRGFTEWAPRVSLGGSLGVSIERRSQDGPWCSDDGLRLHWRGRCVPAAFAPLHHAGIVVGVLVLAADPQRTPPAATEHTLGTAVDLAPAVSEVVAARVLGPIDSVARRAQLHELISTRAFCTVFEPVARLADRDVVGFEALTRFDDGRRPDLWFRDAAMVGLGPALEAATLELAAESSHRLPEGAFVSFNVSASQLESGIGLGQLVATADRPVVLELTERERVDDYAAVRTTLESLDGVRLAVDDAGAGYASLRHILALEPELIKLDSTWVRDLGSDPARTALVRGLVHFAEASSADLVAEGVETEADATSVQAVGVRYAQGRLFGDPDSGVAAAAPSHAAAEHT